MTKQRKKPEPPKCPLCRYSPPQGNLPPLQMKPLRDLVARVRAMELADGGAPRIDEGLPYVVLVRGVAVAKAGSRAEVEIRPETRAEERAEGIPLSRLQQQLSDIHNQVRFVLGETICAQGIDSSGAPE